jgi:hypothetical protein
MRKPDGIWFRGAVTPRLLALAGAPKSDQWMILDYRQAKAWDEFLDEFVSVTRRHLKAGDRAPWPWPPRKDGSIPPESTNPNESVSVPIRFAESSTED